ncbi:MAG: UDP-N-acetylglucosamine--N-acetylmuramyl-(pentapeptide) pyrophosphoryl-undecaprenol N-acetylglucosamine transferase [Candidatus Omnitrophica bacterium]|nr:UDP-N-acetylglucosamine--N-acetylmuramyl-(pentapeptide) pyrophosphoryl-undecaprenol N-acetylglucosamine transferase [Candidatus Omnitrophota bacterium]
MRILVVTGASGGHIFPAQAIIESLRNRQGIEIMLVLPKRSSIKIEGVAVRYIATTPFTLSINLRSVVNVFNFLKACLQSLFLLQEFKPDVIVGFGTIDSVPIVTLAWLARIRILIHEQNVIPGRATRLLINFSDIIALSFPQTQDYLRRGRNRITVTGNPLRSKLKVMSKKEALDFFGFKESYFTILVVGGSQSSHNLNMLFINSAMRLERNLMLQVIHICGSKDYSLLQESYGNFRWQVKLFQFLDQMHYAYSASDLVVSRAGATTIAEIIYFAKPAILVPYPYAYRHQSANARLFQKAGCCLMIEEGRRAEEELTEGILALLNAPEKLHKMHCSFSGFSKTNAAENLVEEVLRLGKN